MKTKLLPPVLASALLLPLPAQADHPETEDDFLDFSLEELISLDIPDVTSVSRKKQRLMDSAAAIYVITSEDIKRSGITSIPEALRMVPGMQVARLNGNTWSISTRGFNYIFANKLLVLIDGRTVYSPLFSGVNWDVQDTLMEDIDRIEVIRGPGAALWGANAVNGVINVITKKAADAQGSLVTLGGGSEEKAFGSYRYGGEFGETGYYKVFVKAFERDGMVKPNGSDANDDWKMKRAGFKTEWSPMTDTSFTVQGDLYEGTTRTSIMSFDESSLPNSLTPLENISKDQRGGNLIAHWQRNINEANDYSVRVVLDDYQNFDYRVTEKRNYADIEFQHYFQPWESHDFTWGLGYRGTWHELSGMRHIIMLDEQGNPENKRFDVLYSAFAQDEITLDDHWNLTLSARLEHNSFTSKEFQPNARMTWRPTEQRTFWAAISRAVKTPSISETAVNTQGMSYVTFPVHSGINDLRTLSINGNRDLKSEVLTGIDFGYREQFTPTFRLDVAGFVYQYDDMLKYVAGNECSYGILVTQGGVTTCVIVDPEGNGRTIDYATQLKNGLKTKTYGIELVADWQAREWWKLQFNYSWFQMDITADQNDSYTKQNEANVESLNAAHTANIRSMMNLPNQWQLDFWVRYMGSFRTSNAEIDPYTALDIRLAKAINKNLEFSIVGQNLFDKQRAEFSEVFSGSVGTEVQESWYAQLWWAF